MGSQGHDQAGTYVRAKEHDGCFHEAVKLILLSLVLAGVLIAVGAQIL